MNASVQCLPSADSAFGPVVDGCRDTFDFTYTFEQYFFSVVPSVILLLVGPLRLYSLRGQRRKVGGKVFKFAKLVAVAMFAILQLALLALWATWSPSGIRTAAITASAVSFVSCLMFCTLSYLEHAKSLRPSLLLNAYLLITFVFDAVILRTLWLTSFDVTIRNLFTASFAVKAIILLLEAKGKREYFNNASDKDRSPEESSGLYSQSLFWWLNTIIKRGFRHVLTPDDLFPVDDAMSSVVLNAQFWKAWKSSSREGKHKLAFVLISILKQPLLVPIIPRLVLVAFTVCQPLLLSRFLDYLQDPTERQNSNIGYGLIGAYGVVYFGMAISTGFYWHRTFRFLTMLRGTLVTAVFSKTTEISITALDNSAAVTLMGTDVERIIVLATWLLERELGVACVGPIAVSAVAVIITIYLSGETGKRQLAWVIWIQKRVGYVPLMISLVVTFAIFKAVNHTSIDASKLFMSLSLLILLTQPLFGLLGSMIDFASALGCFDRIEKFLLVETRVDKRLITVKLSDLGSPTSENLVSRTQEESTHEGIRLDRLKSMRVTAGTSISESKVVSVRDGTFSWTRDGDAILHDINFSIQRSQLVLIVGPVASGKSTLLKALLGETMLSKGIVQISTSSIAWCEQTPWLINASVQKNIIGFSSFDSDLYSSVIHACDLDSDISLFPDRDLTIIGSKGIALSGGQKQRLAIARAIYSRRELAIFDDVFSALDATTRNFIFSRLFGPRGLLRRWGATVMIATHAVNLLPLADHIIALGDDGTIAEQGTLQQLNAAKGYVHGFCLENAEDTIAEESSSASTASGRARYEAEKRKENVRKDGAGDKGRQLGDFSVYRYYFQSLGWQYTALFIFLQMYWSFFAAFPTIWLKWWTDANISRPNEQTGLYLGVYAALQVGGLLSCAVLTWFTFLVMAKNTGIRLHAVTLKTVMSAPMAFFSTTDTGSTTNRFSQDIQLVDSILPLSLMCVGSYLFICIAQAALIASASAYIVICFPALVAAFFLVQKYYLRTSRQMRFLDLEEKAPVYTQFLESLSGLATIRAFSWQRDSAQLNHQLVDRSQRPFYLLFMIQRWLTLVLDLITTVLAILVVGIAFRLRDSVSVGFTGVSLTQIISFTETMKMVILFWTQLETSIGSIARIKQFSAETKDENLPTENHEPPVDWPSTGQVEIQEITAAYSTKSENNALDGISLSIDAGQKIGICGRTRSGKSSLILSLFRMIELNSGSIKIDGIDISAIPRHHIRSRLNAIGDEPYFLAGTVRLNVDPYENCDDGAVIGALKKVQLWKWAETMGGLDAEMDIDMLSHGQRQLFSLARAILRRGRIIVLDEATSSVDRKTDELMQQIIREEFTNHTIIASAHCLDSILDFDAVAVLERGRIVEYGNPTKLLEGPSKFKDLYDSYEMKRAEDGAEDKKEEKEENMAEV